ncbi:hypothetical protein BN1195_02929 [Chryseobacterium oranimense G311]|uniref:hypothetical protein n=1 Tax=Chryseobacterium oranimense TaxID=421058 RepID=UPI000533AB83|nr:hypothetical protein [Chryseobacterium oranimense]CEJ70602.1 hypothetical protein BN1195_02929 [Chryseobacterium oranimense G311]
MKTKIVLLLFFSLALCLKMEAQFSFTNMQDVVNKEGKYKAMNHSFYKTTLTENERTKVTEAVNQINNLSADKEELIKKLETAEDFNVIRKTINESKLSQVEKNNLKNSLYVIQKEAEINDVSNVITRKQNIDSGFKGGKYIFSKDEKEKIITKINSLTVNNKEKLINEINTASDFDDVSRIINASELTQENKDDLEAFANNFVMKAGEAKNATGDHSIRVFFPAGFNHWGSELSTVFFEGSPRYTQFFQNNNIVYNPNLRNLSFNSEVVNDYLGPLRVGIGFQFNSTVKGNDSLTTEGVKKDELVSSLQNGGGNLFINVKYPIIGLGQNSAFGLKAYAYHNTGVELTKINEADNEFVLTNNTGIAIGGFAVGLKEQISGFFEAKAALLYGNSKFNKILSEDEDFKKVLPLFNIGVGVNFLGMYTVKAEFYPAGSYIKRNFPATISFIIVPKSK